MPNAYLGIPGNVAFPNGSTITSATNTNPIVITVSGSLPSQMQTGALVDIQGVEGNTAANGQNVATVLSSNTFSIPVAGNGAFVNSGSPAVTYLFSQSYNQPSDGDAQNAASVNVPLDALGDRTAFNTATTGAYKLVNYQTNYHIVDNVSQWGSQTGLSYDTWTLVDSGSGPFPVLACTACPGDLFDLSLSITGCTFGWGATFSGSTYAFAAIGVQSGSPGGALSSFAEVYGGSTLLFQSTSEGSSGVTSMFGITMTGTYLAAAGTTVFEFGLGALFNSATGSIGNSFSFFGNWCFTLRQWRGTNVPQ